MADYAPFTWHDGSTGGTLVTAARLNALELGLQDASTSAHAAQAQAGGPSIIAPAPSGGDDTTVLQTLLTQAQAAGGGTLELRDGSYNVTSLVTSQSFLQPRIVGQGKNYTTLQATGGPGSIVLKLKGGSGQFSGGFLADLTINGSGSQVGVELADAGGVRWTRIEFGTLAVGMQFHNESTGGFTEFNHGDAEFRSDVVQAVHYKRTGGNESFHGTGFTQGTVFNQPASGTPQPFIIIDQGCFPYEAPLTAAMFARSTVPMIRHLDTAAARHAHFYGHLAIEAFADNTVLVDPAQVPVEYSGGYSIFGHVGFDQGNLRLNEIVRYEDTGFTAWHKTLKVSVPTSSTSPGDLGWWAADTSFIYFVVGQDVWRRVPAQTF